MNGLSSIIQKNRLYVLELKIMRSPAQRIFNGLDDLIFYRLYFLTK